MPTPRASIIAAPARIEFHGQTFFAKDDIKVTVTTETFDVKTSGKPVMKRENNVKVEIALTPNGVWAPIIALINAYATMYTGQDIYGDADVPVVIHSVDGYTYTYTAGALSKLPDIMLSGGKTLFGSMTIGAMGADNTAASAANRRLTIAQSAYPANDGYDPSLIITQGYSATWGNAPWNGFDTDDGWAINLALSTTPKKIDSIGNIGERFADLAITAKAKPVGAMTSSDVLAALTIQGAGAGRGRSLAASGHTLAITGTGVYVALYGASLTSAGDTFSGENNRIDDLTWTANTTFSGGATQPLFFLGTAAPGA